MVEMVTGYMRIRERLSTSFVRVEDETLSKKDRTYETVVQFIQWYNENK